jgi:hypothetical protein
VDVFQALEQRQKPLLPRWLAVLGAVLGSFSLGLMTGKLLMGAKPVIDWTMTIMDFIRGMFYDLLYDFSRQT